MKKMNKFNKQLPAWLSLALLLSTNVLYAQESEICETNADSAEIEAIVTTSLLSWETLIEDEFASTSHPDLVFAYPRERTDVDGALRVFRMWKEKFTDTRVYIHQILVDGNSFAAEYQFATTNIATGLRTAMGTVAIGDVCDGQIILLKEYTDGRVADMQEEGKMPLDEGLEPFPWPNF